MTSKRIDFFISYNNADNNWAEWIAWRLEEAGYSTILQAWDFRPGFNFVNRMQNSAVHSSRTIAVLSPNYLASEFTQPEWQDAFSRDPTGEKGILTPIRVSQCELKGYLSQIIYIDLVGLEEDQALDELIKGVRRSRAKPAAPPQFPCSTGRSTADHPPFPLAVKWDVLVWNPKDQGRKGISIREPSTLPLQDGDGIRIEIMINQPAYVYLIMIDSQGNIQPVYPWTGGRWEDRAGKEEAVKILKLPENQNTAWPLKGQKGRETLVLMARDEPLSDQFCLKDRFLNFPLAPVVEDPGALTDIDIAPSNQAVNTRLLDLENPAPLHDPEYEIREFLSERFGPYFNAIKSISFHRQDK